ncbi:hypothetical protein [Alterisphingorhabdus coralli]|uniref:Glutamate--cysteine ligase n=1 Tax=Alterisphingorhabdus coralli TaxID=3071408 RepID=A0AA97FB63_9SPHN|nr:hypothetical protein [Parasphingorhabdus sp. SCSIO 66989]WOE76407.1 hypothetical protein RB602_06750 [Parasphingorhabdus sp. SCSIO 66989]
MGQEIEGGDFSAEDREEFRNRLRRETATLKQWFDERAFDEDDVPTVGLELEGWLTDTDCLPAPQNAEFIETADDPDIVTELSKFNFELNAPIRTLNKDVLFQTQNDLTLSWQKCERAGRPHDLSPVMIGILPTVRNEMLKPDWMSDSERYRALNREVFRRRDHQPLHISIEGYDKLDYIAEDLMLEAACTSLQSHLKVNQDDAVRLYNAGVIASAPLVAATANSPFLFSKSLWDETRIPAFEQATSMDNFREPSGRNAQRVTLGTGYLKESFLELFLLNMHYGDLLPALSDDGRKLPHLRLQNGTIWRWVRPILGFDGNLSPHLRIEHRVMPAGPSMVDTVANLALCHGLMLALADAETPPESETPFEDARANFYACARHGLHADVRWAGKTVNVQVLLLEKLIPMACDALKKAGVDAGDLNIYFNDILEDRLRNGQTGAAWQRSFVNCHGTNYQALTQRYVEMQRTGKPVHEWTI